jgi:hypothetical protein
MDAEILPLVGKYYGTTIRINNGMAKGRDIKLWFDSGEPSDRELATRGYTRDEWESNIDVDDGCGGISPIKSCGLICDSHYECQETYRVAQAIVDALGNII